MLYPVDIEAKLSFDRIREWLKEKCLSQPGLELVDDIGFSDDYHNVSESLDQTDEFKRILESGEGFPAANYHDVRTALKKSRTAGSFLDPEALLQIRQSLQTIIQIVKYLKNRSSQYPEMEKLVDGITIDDTLIRTIDNAIDENGFVKDRASQELMRIRSSLIRKRQQLRKSLDSIFRKALNDGLIPEGASLTVRDGRMVIPVLVEYKRRIKGFIHDESATGQTVFLEPEQVLENNNELKEFQYAEKREVIRILILLTDSIREQLPALQKCYEMLGLVDLIRAKALLAIKLKAVKPALLRSSEFKLDNARHPLLQMTLEKSGRNIVPMSLQLNSSQRLIIISGPNAGGKSVCLKTAGLLQYMLQCGLLIAVDETSSVGLFRDIFIDIGDEQSIENDLSTYSSHLAHMKHFISHAGDHTLLLIDEFGTGTDPQLGGAIAEAILEQLVKLKPRGIITTHYGNIKHYAEDHEAVVNGAMKYDIELLEPLYQLQVGKPGSSFSFEVARKIGLPGEIIDHARHLLDDGKVDIEDLILRLEQQEQKIKERDIALGEKEQRANELEGKYRGLYERLEAEQKEIIINAKKEAENLLRRSNKEIEKTIRHIKENKAEKKETRRVREKLEGLKKQVASPAEKNVRIELAGQAASVISKGDHVRLIDSGVTGEVLDLRGKEAEVQIGALKSRVRINKLEKISGKEKKRSVRSSSSVGHTMDINKKLAEFGSILDIRGVRGEEALGKVDKFLDDALLFGVNEVKILHGKGDGILRKIIREHLRHTSFIANMRDEHVEHGGAGITVLELK